ncbi:MAG: hypothetical protein A2182_02750 [Candidatus Pacebacteria bacterium RIFOXYA1_FULL_38_18]|nr:MAG: hypothetical protein A2182_02750 [Candidatus Pacebacteria bacterium RIFOXYA1_FULL_38_18]
MIQAINKELELSPEYKQSKGTLVLDIDGTLTDPNNQYKIYQPLIETLSSFINNGGSIVISSGGTFNRINYSLILPISQNVENISLFKNSFFIIPEYGSAIYEFSEQKWVPLLEFDLPNKNRVRNILKKFTQLNQNSFIAGPSSQDRIFRQYSLGLKGLENPIKTKNYFIEKIIPKYPEIDWNNISLRVESSTIDFCHVKARKDTSLYYLLKLNPYLAKKIYGFGDNADEFAYVVPTFDVKRGESEFEEKLMPYIKTPQQKTNGEAVDEIINFLNYFSFGINGM